MVIGYVFHGLFFKMQRYKIKLRFASFPPENRVKICLISTSICQKNKKALRLSIDAINTNYQSDGHGLQVRSLRTQSLLPAEKQRAWLSLSASSVSILLACGNDI